MIILAVGKLKRPYKDLEIEFLKRMKNVNVIEIKESNKRKETVEIIKKLENFKSYRKVLCDVKGKIVDESYFDNLDEKTVFIVGGPDGFEDEIKRYVDEIISFSPLTFNHQLFRIMLLEQIYRSFCRRKGYPYAKH